MFRHPRQSPIESFQNRQNALLFGLRSFLQWGRGPYSETAESKQGLFSETSQALANSVIERYKLEAFYQSAGRQRFLENMTLLTQLESLLPEGFSSTQNTQHWLDVGAKNWSYVEALWRFAAQKSSGQLTVTGLELDAYRRYTNLHTRYEYAEAFTRHLPNTHYKVGNILAHTGQYRVISHFLPFVFKRPLRRWGLPDAYFQPEEILLHLEQQLAPGGRLLIVNQGREEADEQARLLKHTGIQQRLNVTEIGPLPDPFGMYQHTRYGFTVA